MAKKGWPTVSKGIFYPGFKSGASEGQRAGERPNTKIEQPSVQPETVRGRMVHEASNKMNPNSMRLPFGK